MKTSHSDDIGVTGTQRAIGKRLLDLMSLPGQLRALVRQQLAQQNQLVRISLKKDECLRGLQTLSKDIEALYQRQDCMESAGRQRELLTGQHYENHVIDPLARQLFPIIDLADQSLSTGTCSRCSLHDALEAVRSQALELLACYGIALFTATPGITFDAKTMNPAEIRPTVDHTMDRTVAANLRCGFRRDQRILRPMHVAVYRFEIPPIGPSNINNKESIS